MFRELVALMIGCVMMTSCKVKDRDQQHLSDVNVVGLDTKVADVENARSTVLLMAQTGKKSQMCTGAYISPGVILTAWHCVSNMEKGGVYMVVFQMDVALASSEFPKYSSPQTNCVKGKDGKLDLSGGCSTLQPVATALKASERVGSFDLALAYFDEKFIESSYSGYPEHLTPKIAPLSSSHVSSAISGVFQGYGGTKVYGDQENPDRRTHLRSVNVDLTPFAEISEKYPSYGEDLMASVTQSVIREEMKYEQSMPTQERKSAKVSPLPFEHLVVGFAPPISQERLEAQSLMSYYACEGDSGAPIYGGSGEVLAILSWVSSVVPQSLKTLYEGRVFFMDSSKNPDLRGCSAIFVGSMVSYHKEAIEAQYEAYGSRQNP